MDLSPVPAEPPSIFAEEPVAADIPPERVVPGLAAITSAADIPPPPLPQSPLNALRATLQPIAGALLADQAYWELLKRNASPRTFLEFVRFAFAADLEGRPGAALNQQIIVQAPFPRGPLDELPPHMKIE